MARFITLGDFAIGAAATQTGEPVVNLGGMAGVSLAFVLTPVGTPGTDVKAWLQGSHNQGSRWHDLACRVLTSAAPEKLLTLGQGGSGNFLAMTDGALADDTILNSGIVPLFDRLRLKLINATAWGAGTILSARAAIRF